MKFLSSYETYLTESPESHHTLVLDIYAQKTFNEVFRGGVDFYAKVCFSKLAIRFAWGVLPTHHAFFIANWLPLASCCCFLNHVRI